ncbi:hypothetical protein AMS68_001032 [Peltaster fructicola]|uniref:Uncharacterized protein n=1 Tax=Peltaster fructicola TaxID=286661 RepID=A0A6H0XLL0_9PEZI|nr:hypothetical protein AMS68_001032 [Peltaster fructicola]
MEYERRQKSRNVEHERSRSREDRSLLRSRSPSQQPLTAPIPQTQWRAVPDVFHPPGWNYLSGDRDKPLPIPPSAREEQQRSNSPSKPKTKRRKHRPGSLRSPEGPNAYRPDPNLLYPEMNPYEAPMVHSAPHNMQHFPRSQLQPTSLDIYAARSVSADPRPAVLPRSPTYPGGSRARTRSNPQGIEHGLQDEEDMRLFMEATTGLGPIPMFRQNSITEDDWLNPRPAPTPQHGRVFSASSAVSPMSEYTGTLRSDWRSRVGREHAVSPMGETPTTMQALRGLAQMPNARSPSTERRRRQEQPDPIIDISDSGLDVWDDAGPSPMTQGPQSHAPPQHHLADSWMEDDHPGPDDELPTYASSQAQAHASQRAEATRRAQELQRRWREGGRRYGPDG